MSSDADGTGVVQRTNTGRTHQTGAHAGVFLVERAHVARVLVVIDDFVGVGHGRFLKAVGGTGAQCAAHWMDFKSMPSRCISQSGDMSRSRLT